MSDQPHSLQDLMDRARSQAGLRDHRGSFDDDYEAMDAERSSRAAWWPFIRLAVLWADAFPKWTSDDWMGPGRRSL